MVFKKQQLDGGEEQATARSWKLNFHLHVAEGDERRGPTRQVVKYKKAVSLPTFDDVVDAVAVPVYDAADWADDTLASCGKQNKKLLMITEASEKEIASKFLSPQKKISPMDKVKLRMQGRRDKRQENDFLGIWANGEEGTQRRGRSRTRRERDDERYALPRIS